MISSRNIFNISPNNGCLKKNSGPRCLAKIFSCIQCVWREKKLQAFNLFFSPAKITRTIELRKTYFKPKFKIVPPQILHTEVSIQIFPTCYRRREVQCDSSLHRAFTQTLWGKHSFNIFVVLQIGQEQITPKHVSLRLHLPMPRIFSSTLLPIHGFHNLKFAFLCVS